MGDYFQIMETIAWRERLLKEIKEHSRAKAKLERSIPRLELKIFHIEIKLRYAKPHQVARYEANLLSARNELVATRESIENHELEKAVCYEALKHAPL